MINRFNNIEYLKQGNARQQLAYSEIIELNIFKKLGRYNPILTGTIPIEIDVPESDLDIICECKDHQEFSEFLIKQFGAKTNFEIYSTDLKGIESTIAKFKTDNFIYEIFGKISLQKNKMHTNIC